MFSHYKQRWLCSGILHFRTDYIYFRIEIFTLFNNINLRLHKVKISIQNSGNENTRTQSPLVDLELFHKLPGFFQVYYCMKLHENKAFSYTYRHFITKVNNINVRFFPNLLTLLSQFTKSQNPKKTSSHSCIFS